VLSSSSNSELPGSRSKSKGLYILLIAACGEVTVGRLGRHRFDGRYLYVGSARGPGGLRRRIERHLAIASGKRKRGPKHWHIDYLLELGRLERIWLLPDAASPEKMRTRMSECELVRQLVALGAQPAVRGFGASDSPCETHLLELPSELELDRLISHLESLKQHG